MARHARNRNKIPVIPEIKYAVIESLDQEGRGVTHVDGKTIFVDGALPNEKVTFQSIRIKPSYEVANVVEVLKQSNQRVTPKCPHFGLCGGCKLQHLDFAAQVAAKQRLLENDLWHIGKVKAENMLPPLYGPTWGYRHKARLSVKYVEKKQRVLVGFNEKATRYVADMNSCEVLVPEVSALIAPLQQMIAQLSLRDKLPQIELAVGEQTEVEAEDNKPVIVLILRIMAAPTLEDEALLKLFADDHAVQIWTQTKGPDTIKPFYPLSAAALKYSLPEFNLTYPFKPNEFTQVNPQINQVMIRRAMQLLAPQSNEKIADFFCGIGNFTLPIARSGAQVLGLEGLANLVDRANESAALNQINNTNFGVADLFKMTPEALTNLGRFDKWLVDPPRDGAFELIKSLDESNSPQRIVYVSCNPATLARDAGVLVNEKGYILSAAGVINMFPHTAHVESIALFEKYDFL
ncbi:MAG: 23S rRNA (uracil(1939)-C(5))-methyltransferase RlmD [Methylotenera sp.]|uniref:23S rRNA (uracil(1939)-C(5))-methyltransferase RlmD n=1 Tax=Methylotenera sp. TaxID=2051956 RepID=UPI0027247D59|nr:23S rRNA (uracil(1939)-C(5))-methyltransferase RlmD [Methylotenera sp.]MDO9394385.1 23S rRNA (uracil(1939)-C(5))-methyltransferase RlmD [Methylotenera sp.]MDP1522307.1 23S rRNA (uracil(1939)-C(5))-methyltransferase RlmD [Methylotenera sp.]MDP2231125.1 23S rRNA (uracil(1939)-C(5))-methyltransferase RlmD [Methylotenera sp.]